MNGEDVGRAWECEGGGCGGVLILRPGGLIEVEL